MSLNWKDVGQAIGKAAPLLGGVLGGPVGAAAGSLVASCLNVEATPQTIMDALNNDPDAALKLKQLEIDNRANIMNWYTAQFKIEADDRKNARQAAIDGGDRERLFWLSVFLFCVAFGMEGIILMWGFDPRVSGELVGRVLGTVDTLAVTVTVYWFGTSRSNQDNESMLYHSTPTTTIKK